MKTHTPGPWELTKDGVHLVETGRVAGDRLICGFPGNVNFDTIALSNARLIEAAPELLAALKELYNDWGIIARPDAADCADAHFNRIVALINKAEGG